MSTLTVVRHAQARPFEPDSDRLSDVGELQARALGEYWSRNGIAFDQAWSGALLRHRQTAALALRQTPQVSSDWNEYDVDGILTARPASFADPRAFQKEFEISMQHWLAHSANDSTNDSANGAEPWTGFRDRVLRGLRMILEGPSNRSIVLFTSGGPIGVLVQTALNAPDQSFLDVNWRVRNCSITEFVFRPDRISLDSFNAIPHLTESKLRTFR